MTSFSCDPLTLVRELERAGLSALHWVDLNGAFEGTRKHDNLLEKIVKGASLSVQTGGGIRRLRELKFLFELGVERVVLSTALFTSSDPSALLAYASKLVAALDVEDEEVKIRGWQEGTSLSLWEALKRVEGMQIPTVLITDIARDGMLQSPHVALYRKVKQRFPKLTLQASGGVRSLADLQALKDAGADAAIVGRALHEGALSIESLSRFAHAQ